MTIEEFKKQAEKGLLDLDGFFDLFDKGKTLDSHWSKVALSKLRKLMDSLSDEQEPELKCLHLNIQELRLGIVECCTCSEQGVATIQKPNELYVIEWSDKAITPNYLWYNIVPKPEPSKDLDEVARKMASKLSNIWREVDCTVKDCFSEEEMINRKFDKCLDKAEHILAESGLVMAVDVKCECGGKLLNEYKSHEYSPVKGHTSILRCDKCEKRHRVTLSPTTITAIERTGG